MRPVVTSGRSRSVLLLALPLVLAMGSACTGGSEGPDATAVCTGATGCNGECELGNSWGVGRYCTVGGGECADTPNRLAPFCTLDFEPDAEIAMCTRPCVDDTQCGEDAICRDESGTGEGSKGCVPMFCLE